MIWSILGFTWHALCFHRGLPRSADYTIATLTGSGYRGIPANASPFQFVLSALYAAVAIPLMRISEGEDKDKDSSESVVVVVGIHYISRVELISFCFV